MFGIHLGSYYNLVIGGVFAYLVYFYVRYVLLAKIPGPRPWPLLGNTFEVLRNTHRLNDWLSENSRKYGTFVIQLPFQPRMVVVADPGSIEYMLKTNFDNFEKGPHFQDRMRVLLGHGIFNADGDEWRGQRKTASFMFNVRNFRDHMVEVFLNHGEILLGKLAAAAKSGELIDVQDLFYRYTLDSIGVIGFGEDFKTLTQGEVPFAMAFDGAQQTVNDRFVSALWPIRQYILPEERRLPGQVAIMDEFVRELLRRRRQESPEEMAKRHDLLSLFLSGKDDDGKPYSDQHLRDVVLNFMIAGRDTTAGALSWTFYLLAKHPHERERVEKEIDATLQGMPPSYEAVQKEMPYMQATFTEVLRLYPSVPKDMKMALEADTLPDKTPILPGDAVAYVPYAMGRMASLWPEPLTFNPSRFLTVEAPVKFVQPSQYLFPAFNAGPRVCLGKNMAYLEANTLMTMILQKYTLEIPEGTPEPTYVTTLTMPIRGGLRMRVIPRK